jgi:hypothetical protein
MITFVLGEGCSYHPPRLFLPYRFISVLLLQGYMQPLDIAMKVKNIELIPNFVYISFGRRYSVSEFEIGIG